MGDRRLMRSRWAAVGAAIAVSLGGGGAILVNAASSAPSSVITIDPVRILDTRDAEGNIGLAGPFASLVSQKLQVTGSVPTKTGAQIVVPAGATGVLLNVTVVSPTAAGFLSVRPGDAIGTPTTSSLNFTAGAVVPNSVQVGLPTSGANNGQIDITYGAGAAGPSTEVLIDVVGYTTDAKLNALQSEIDAAEAAIAALQTANAVQDAYIQTVLLGTAAVPSGRTVTGYGQFDHSIIVDNEDVFVAVQLPGRSAAPLTAGTVNFSPGSLADDDDASCTGTAVAPTAPAGRVCIYRSQSAGIDAMEGWDAENMGFASQFFLVSGTATGTPGTDLFLRFSWAYTAP